MSVNVVNNQEEYEEPFERIDAERARRMVDSGEARLIDVREQDEWDAGHAPQAQHVPLKEFLANPGKYVQPADKVVFTCAVGQRSAVAAEMAAAVGLEHVYNLEGGIKDWRARGFPVE